MGQINGQPEETNVKTAPVTIDCEQIIDWNSFHDIFAETFGFPGFYGRNMDAWIDCLTRLDAPDDGMTTIHAPADGCVVLQLENVKSFKVRCREIYDALIECSAFVNWRRIERDFPPVLVLSLYG